MSLVTKELNLSAYSTRAFKIAVQNIGHAGIETINLESCLG